MEEAERLCDRVAIFDQGRIIAQGTPAQLIESLGADQIVEFSLTGADDQPVEIPPAEFGRLAGVSRVDAEDGTLRLTVNDPSGVLAELVHLLADRRARLASLTTRRASLDDVFVHLTGRRIDQSDDKAAA
jgi:ABC-2 type transport system ATP-binding protein